MKDRLGAWQEGIDPTKGKVKFKIFFPSTTVDPVIIQSPPAK
jgi:hypothetical protein